VVELLEAWCFMDTEDFIYLFIFLKIWLDLLFCRLLWNDLSELVLVMEHDLGCSMDIFYELCES
jgi:hypothetical protein